MPHGQGTERVLCSYIARKLLNQLIMQIVKKWCMDALWGTHAVNDLPLC